MTLTDFLLARIADDEAEARILDGHYRRHELTGSDLWVVDSGPSLAMSPDRALAECKAKREIVLQQRESQISAEGDDLAPWAEGMAYAGVLAMRYLATVYADHPDYREEWKP